MSNRTAEHDMASYRRIVVAAVFVALVHVAWLAGGFGGREVTRYASTVLLIAEGVFAAIMARNVARDPERSATRSWAVLAWGAAAWTSVRIAGVALGQPPGNEFGLSTWADVAPLVFAPFAIGGLLLRAELPVAPAARARAFLDAVIVGVALAFVSWTIEVRPHLDHLRGSAERGAMLVLQPAADVVIATVGLFVLAAVRSQGRVRLPVALPLAVMAAGFLASDTALFLTVDPTFRPGTIVDAGWGVAMLALGVAAAWRRPFRTENPGRPISFAVAQVVPSLIAGAVLTAALARVNRTGEMDVLSVWLASTIVICVLVRQVVTSIEEQRLARLLEARVVDRTEQLSQREQQFRALVQHSSDIIVIMRPDGCFDYVSPSVQYVLGHSAESLENGNIADIVFAEDRQRVLALLAMATRRSGATMTAEWRVTRADGSLRQVEALVRNLVSEPAVGGIVLNLRDVTERKELEDQLTHQALHDDLTGLANRALLRLRIEQALARWLFQNDPFSLLVVDIDDFKSINDSLGHVAGDLVLKTLAERISHCIRRGDSIVRLAGDEFALLLEGVAADDEEAHNVAQRVIAAVHKPIRVEGRQLALRASIGLACVTEQVSQADDILRNADLALHKAKDSKRGGYVKFELAMYSEALRRVEMEADLRRALERDELQLYYQPTVDIATGKFEGVEALLRWPHPERGFISPADFVPIAEESGLIVPIGTWVLHQACAQMAKWQVRYPSEPALKMNVNLSGRQLDQPDIVDTVRKVIEDTGIAASSLVLEMTESVLMENKPTTRAKMQALVDLGCELAIDDFGTGYSSLSYLRQFPISVLKIDRSFVMGVGTDGTDEESALVQAIVDLAKTLQLRTVAEGIETGEQLMALRSMGCDIGQGFLMAKPAPAEDVRRLLESTHAVGLPLPSATAQ